MKKWFDGMEAADMLKKVTRKWVECGEYPEGQRGPCGEMGWEETYVEIDGITYRLRYDRDGFPDLTEV